MAKNYMLKICCLSTLNDEKNLLIYNRVTGVHRFVYLLEEELCYFLKLRSCCDEIKTHKNFLFSMYNLGLLVAKTPYKSLHLYGHQMNKIIRIKRCISSPFSCKGTIDSTSQHHASV